MSHDPTIPQPAPPAPKAPRYRPWQAPWLSLYSAAFYRDVAKRWSGRGFLYLLVLLSVCWAVEAVIIHIRLRAYLRAEVEPVIEQVPPVVIKSGRASVQAPQPVYIKAASGETLAILDTSGERLDLNGTNASLLLTRFQLYIKNPRYGLQNIRLRNVSNLSIDRTDLRRACSLVGRWLVPAAYLPVLAGLYGYRVVQALLYGLIAKLMGLLMGARLSYPACLRLSAVAVTPAVLAATIFSILEFQPPYWWVACFVIAMICLFFGVTANVPSRQS
ncbi:MAG TPA: DUF1189 family protein [Candidatus Brocadiia bacterium]|nr:DUF1189 family protein [Candidatus Brocadiia bacterium]